MHNLFELWQAVRVVVAVKGIGEERNKGEWSE